MGGAIFNHRGSVSLVNCTLAYNEADGGLADTSSGAMYGSGLGAAIFNLNGTVNLSFSTISGNRLRRSNGATSPTGGPAGGAIYSLAFGNTIEDGTATNASFTQANSIVWGTSSGLGESDLINNVVAGLGAANTGNSSTLSFAGTNIVGVQQNSGSLDPTSTTPLTVDPKLDGQLAPNGAPLAPMTFAFDGGAALNSAVGPCPATDERGVPRPQFGACDVGAYEASAADDWIFADGFEL